MALSFVNVATAQANTAATSLPVNVPAGTVNNNLLITLLELNTAVTITPPAGWTHLATFPITNGTNITDGWYRIANTEPASYTWTFGSSLANIVALSYAGNPNTNPIDASSAATDGSPTTTTPTITAHAGDWIICGFTDKDAAAGSTWTTPAGTTSRAALLNTGTAQGSLAVFDTNGPITFGTYSYTSTASTTNSNNTGFIIAVYEAFNSADVFTYQAVNRASTY